jgi:hypothetical protein
MSLSRMDWDVIDARVTRAIGKPAIPTKSIAFLRCVLLHYFPALQEEMNEIVTDGANDRGVDALHIVENEDYAEVFVFQSKYRDTFKSASRTINENETLKIRHFLEEVFCRSDELATIDNYRLSEQVKRIWNLHRDGKILKYKVVYCSNGAGLASSASDVMSSFCREHPHVSYEFYGARDFIRDLTLHGKISENGALHVVGKEILERSDGDVRGVIASIDARSFISLICEENSTSIKRHLFDDNLRIFLGIQGGYNQAIISTASSEDSHLFWYLNNGITITCRNYSYNKGHTNPVLKLEDFQIVNGAQTSHSLIEAFRLNPDTFENVIIMVRVYATERTDIAERVAVATNSQARIQGRDLRANHSVLKKLELAFQERGFYFERKRNMYSSKPSERRIDALKLGQIILSFYLREPDKAKSESDSIFDHRFSYIFHERYDTDELLSVVLLYQVIENLRDNYLNDHRASLESGHDHQYLVYGHWFILYTCNLLIAKGNPIVPVGKNAVNLVEDAIKIVASACDQNKAVAHYQLFRSPKTKDKILSELHGKQPDFFELLFAN